MRPKEAMFQLLDGRQKHKICLLFQDEFRKQWGRLESVAVSPQGETSADTPFPRPQECCMGKKWGKGCNTAQYVKLWLTRERGSLTCDYKGQNMRINVSEWQVYVWEGKKEKKEGACTINGRGSFTVSFTPSSQSCHSTTYTALCFHRNKSASELLSFGLFYNDSSGVWMTTCGNLHWNFHI